MAHIPSVYRVHQDLFLDLICLKSPKCSGPGFWYAVSLCRKSIFFVIYSHELVALSLLYCKHELSSFCWTLWLICSSLPTLIDKSSSLLAIVFGHFWGQGKGFCILRCNIHSQARKWLGSIDRVEGIWKVAVWMVSQIRPTLFGWLVCTLLRCTIPFC